MAEELSIISSSMLTDVSETEINSLIEKIVASSKNNMDEICELTVECTTLLASAESRSTALSNQGIFKRLIGNFTGKNQKLRNSILKDQTNALYAAQGVINRVMAECNNNRKLMLAVNDRISDIYLELKENQNEVAAGVLMIRKAIVAFYKQYKEELLEQETRISKVEQFARERCQKCQEELLSWQRICPYCGEIHSLKTDNINEETRKILGELSKIINSEDDFEDMMRSVINEMGNTISGLAITKLAEEGISCDITPPILYFGKEIQIIPKNLQTIIIPFQSSLGFVSVNIAMDA